MSLYYKVVPVQYWQYEYDLFTPENSGCFPKEKKQLMSSLTGLLFLSYYNNAILYTGSL